MVSCIKFLITFAAIFLLGLIACATARIDCGAAWTSGLSTGPAWAQEIKKNAIDSLESISGRVLGDDPSRWETWISKPSSIKSLGPQTRRGIR